MKKTITICLLAVTLLVGGMGADAKTTRKKSSTKASTSVSQSNTFGINSFLEKKSGEWDIKSDNNIEATLVRLGFEEEPVAITPSTSRPIIEDEAGDYTTPQGCYCDDSTTFCEDIHFYEKDGIQVSLIYSSYLGSEPWFDSVLILFPSKEKRNSFINGAPGMGFKKIDSETYILCKGRCINLNLIGERTLLMCQDEAY